MTLRKVKMSYRCGKKGPSLNHLLFMDDQKLFGKSEKQIDSLTKTFQKCGTDIAALINDKNTTKYTEFRRINL
ncbi:Hypothetical predicted protein [Octopus vulgaris]|uniref:Uncharacterized protein n=1 Tax=Octopus vulgaris TaxID=6645 RepID=A0AA36EWA6_OCTVU|nr:Hypothetical predicted protein [Octopus vulgaris]